MTRLGGSLCEEGGFALVELLITCVVLGILMAGLSGLLTSSIRASSDTDARLAGQLNVRLAFDRLEYETRCASTASILSGGAGVHLAAPVQCTHAPSDVTWCASGGNLVRIVGTSCAGTGETFIRSVTSPTPFSCYAPVGPLPQLRVTLALNPTGRSSDTTLSTDWITMRNAVATTSTSTACS